MSTINLEQIIEDQIDAVEYTTKFFTKRKILLFALIILGVALGGSTFVFRGYVTPVNNIIKQNLSTQKQFEAINLQIQKAEFKRAKLSLQAVQQQLKKTSKQLSDLKQIGNSRIDEPVAALSENIDLSLTYANKLSSYIDLLEKTYVRVELYDQYILVTKPKNKIINPPDADTIYQTKAQLEIAQLAMDESCSQKNSYIKKINLCPKISLINQSLSTLLSNSPTKLSQL